MLLRNKKEIEEWLKKYDIKYYKLIEDKEYGYVVNVNQSVYLGCKSLNLLKVKFNEIDGSFNCEKNILKSLEGCPKKVNGYFDCSYNKLKSLVGGPEYVRGGFYCNDNQLTSLEGCPEIINLMFDCNNNKLESLKELPNLIHRDLSIQNNKLKLSMLIDLQLKDIKDNIFLGMNPELGELQGIRDINEIKRIFKIYQEKESLDVFMKNNFDVKNQEITDKAIVKINKI